MKPINVGLLGIGTVGGGTYAVLARNAAARGLTRRPWVKTSLAPGSRVVTDYLQKAGLLAESDVAGFDISVETANGTVSLSGDVDSQAQIDRATAVAREIEGVRAVDAKQLRVNPNR